MHYRKESAFWKYLGLNYKRQFAIEDIVVWERTGDIYKSQINVMLRKMNNIRVHYHRGGYSIIWAGEKRMCNCFRFGFCAVLIWNRVCSTLWLSGGHFVYNELLSSRVDIGRSIALLEFLRKHWEKIEVLTLMFSYANGIWFWLAAVISGIDFWLSSKIEPLLKSQILVWNRARLGTPTNTKNFAEYPPGLMIV